MKRRVPTLAEMEAKLRARTLPIHRVAPLLLNLRPKGERNDAWKARDPKWAELREDWLKEWPRCQAKSRQCQGERQVHHVGPRHLYKDLIYHRGNLLTLCEWHHWTLGHGSDPQWMAWLPNVRQLAEESRLLGWTSQDVIDRARRERIFEWRPFEVKMLPKPEPQKPASRIVRVGAVLALALLVGGCAHGPGFRVSVSLTPLPIVTIQVGGGDLQAAPEPAGRPEDPDTEDSNGRK